MNKTYKTLLALMLFTLTASGVFSQSVRSTYFLRNSTTRSYMNPAFRPDRGYIGIPALSNINIEATTNFFTYDNLMVREGGKDVSIFETSNTELALSRFPESSTFSTDTRVDLLSGGFYTGKNSFWSVNFSVRAIADVGIPKKLMEMAKSGYDFASTSNTPDYLINDMNIRATAMSELGVGYSRSLLGDRLLVGARAKLIGGLADAHVNVNKIEADITEEAGVKYLQVQSDMMVQGSAPGIKAKFDSDGNFNGFDLGKINKISGFGLGLDLGGAYDFSDFVDGLKVSLSVTDIGFINWNKKHSVYLAPISNNEKIQVDGYGEDLGATEAIEKAIEDLNKAISLEEKTATNRNTSLNMALHAGVEYSFLADKMSVGMLYTKRSHEFFNTDEYTFAVNTHPVSWFAASATYSVLNNKSLDAIGLALVFSPSKVLNLFIATDYVVSNFSKNSDLPLPRNANTVNAQIGLSVPIGGRK